VIVDTTHQFYYVDVVDPTLRELDQFQTFSNKVMDVVHKEHMVTFHKQLLYMQFVLVPIISIGGSNSL